jgi:DNA methylase.
LDKLSKKRLELSLKFLKDDGLLFISIDDNEYANLKILCDELLGKKKLFRHIHYLSISAQ